MTISLEELRELMDAMEGENLEFKEARHSYQFDKLLKYCAAIANEGQMPFPTLLSNQAGETRFVISPGTAEWVRQAMALTVTEGPARGAAVPGVTVAGKVGTAETGGDTASHAWFVGFAPAGPGERPRFAVAVVVEHGGKGSQAAAPIAARLLELALAAP